MGRKFDGWGRGGGGYWPLLEVIYVEVCRPREMAPHPPQVHSRPPSTCGGEVLAGEGAFCSLELSAPERSPRIYVTRIGSPCCFFKEWLLLILFQEYEL